MSDEETFTADEQAFIDSRGETTASTTEERGADQAQADSEAAEEGTVDTDALDADGLPADKKDTRVPLATLLEERRRGREQATRSAEVERRLAVFEERWRMLEAAARQPEKLQEDPDPEPDPHVDIFAHQQWVARQVKAERDARQQAEAQTAQTRQAQDLEGKIWEFWKGSASEYKAQKPEFEAAATFLAATRDKQLASLAKVNPQLATKDGRDQVVNGELKQIIIAAAQQGISPAEIIHNMAIEWGFTPQQAANVGEDGAAALTALADKVGGSKSLSAAGGARPETGSVRSVADMSDAEFQAWYGKPENVAKLKRMMGG